MNQKGFSNIILAIVIVIFLGVFGYFAFIKKFEPIPQQPTSTTTQTKTPTPTTTPKDETANWKVYRNDTYGFELKYPDNWEVDENSALGGGILEKGETQFTFTSPDFSLDTGLAFVFSVRPTTFKNNQEFLLWRKNTDESNPNTKGKWITKEINFFNIGQVVEWDTQTNKTLYSVKVPYLYEFSDYRTNLELSKIMSTFKFTH